MSMLQLIVNESTRKLSNRISNQVFVVNDANVDTIRFSIPAGFSDIDIDENASFRVMYIPPGIDKTVYAKTLTFVQNDGVYISYDWQVGPNVLVESGILTVSFCILKTGSEVQEWHTIPYTIPVSNTIHTDDSDEADETITPTVAERVAVLETMIQRVASGAPIVVSSMSAMTDTDKIYMLSTDGNWYYHNGSTWVAGGVYGAGATAATDTTLTQAGIPADAKAVGDKIKRNESDLSIIKKSVKYPYTDGKFINENGKLAANAQYAYTEFVPCDYNTEIYLIDIRAGSSVLAYAFYSEKDENSFISGQNNLTGDDYNITIPQDAKYVRFSSRTTDGYSNTWNPQAYVHNSLTITKKVETLQNDVSEIENDVSELQSNVSNINEKISAITPEDTTFFDIYDFIELSFVKYVSGMVDSNGKFQVRDNFSLTSIEIKVEPNTTYVLEIPGANRNTGTSNDTGIFEGNTKYNTLTVTISGDYLTFTTGSDVSYAVIYFYSGTYDMSHGIEGIHLYKDSVKTSTTPTVKLENLPASVKGNAEPLNILIFGDSITDTINFTIDSETDTTTAYSVKVPNNSYRNGQGQLIQYEMWPTLIQSVLNVAELRNYAKAGAHFYTTSRTPADPRQKLLYQVEIAFNDLTNPNGVFPSNDFEPDIIIIACGINDGNIASGSFETTMAKTVMNQAGTGVDVEATMNAMNQQNTMDAMRYVLMKIKQRFPTALLLYVNPLQQTYSTNEARLTAREELRKMAEQCGFINLDGFGEFGIVRDFETQNEVGLLTKDGLHPNDKGQNLYARNIVQAIKRYYFPLDSFNP